ncbi:hypothetical protein GF339_10265, partial [candidate division KSB3 bacterium]|nr:hypothetical protein [candidate division KSB3 bacterium]MBD3324959.1 hypothetical protein [candidate division KSB3 bacterium]
MGRRRRAHIIQGLAIGLILLSLIEYGVLIFLRQETHGLSATYYANQQWQGPPALTKVDPEISSAALQQFRQTIPQNQFSIEWQGYIEIPETAVYTFATESDDGSWLFIDDQLVVDNGGVHGLVRKTGNIQLTQGQHPITIRYVQMGGYAVLRLAWQRGQSEFVPLPTEVLRPATIQTVSYRLYQAARLFQPAVLLLWACVLLAVVGGVLILYAKAHAAEIAHALKASPARFLTFFRTHRKQFLIGVLLTLGFFLGFALTYDVPPPGYDAYFFPQKQPESPVVDSKLALTQLFLAVICAYWTMAVVRYVKSRSLRSIFWKDKKIVFWAYFLIATGVFAVWLLGQWPGGMTPDSFWSWDQTLSLSFDDWHPYLYQVYLLMLRQFADSPATVAVFQILLTAGVGSYIFYFCIRQGVNWLYTLPFFLLFITSIPIGVYNITLWKDIPWSLCLVLTAFWIFRLQITKTTTGDRPPITRY